MRDFSTLSPHPAIKELVDVVCDKTQNKSRNFFSVEAAYFLAKMAASMRAEIVTKDRGNIPVNIYALAFGPSGFGKGHSVSIFENLFLKGFRSKFMEHSFNQLAEANISRIATERAVYKNTDQSAEEAMLNKEFRSAGSYPFTFDSGTTPAVKQLREKLLISGCGSINLQIDEIGSNMLNNIDILNTYLELYDQGKTKTKLIKNSVDNNRGQEIEGSTPANMLLFGTPSKLLDGGNTEEQFFEFLETGYARRCIFAWGQHVRAAKTLTAAEIYANLTSTQNSNIVDSWAQKFTALADPLCHKWKMELQDPVAIELLEYKHMCEREADLLSDHQDMKKAELSHRYFKTLKLAGVFAFLDRSPIISMDNLYHAIHLVEESGRDFDKLLTREKSYAKLARYISAHDEDLTHADLYEALPFYKAGNQFRNEIMTLATAWGYKNNIVIKKSFTEGIEFFSGDMLPETSLDEMMFSCSTDFATDYGALRQPFEKLHLMTQTSGWHWCNHSFTGNHRRGDNVIEGFNMVVLDVDGTAKRELVHDMLREMPFMTYTTKRHTEKDNRFRVIIPLKYELKLDAEDYKLFMDNIIQWLPFDIDEGANQRERKWLSNDGEHHYNLQGSLLDPIRFIPKTTRNVNHQKTMTELKDLSSVERWFAERMVMGSRNNHMIKFGMFLADSGMQFDQVEEHIIAFNSKLDNGLSEGELASTILRSVAKKMYAEE